MVIFLWTIGSIERLARYFELQPTTGIVLDVRRTFNDGSVGVRGGGRYGLEETVFVRAKYQVGEIPYETTKVDQMYSYVVFTDGRLIPRFRSCLQLSNIKTGSTVQVWFSPTSPATGYMCPTNRWYDELMAVVAVLYSVSPMFVRRKA